MESKEELTGSGECNWCGEPAQLCCSSCGERWYCNREHQRRDSGDHYKECKSYKVMSSTEAGQFIVASRDMKAGMHVLQDDPLVIGPLGISDLVCLGCHSPIYEENFIKCPDCSWPVCSLDCIYYSSHYEECKILSRDKTKCGVPQTQGSTPRYDLIFIVRCLLLKYTNPKAWNLLQGMASHGRERKKRGDPHHVAAIRFLTEICNVDFDVDTVHHVRGVVVTNPLEIRGPNGGQLRALYPKISLFNHSCLPNIHLSSSPDGVMEARTAVNVKKGDQLCISYTETVAPLWERQACLTDVYYFKCSCKRCSDPSELATHFSSSKCPQCSQVILTPTVGQNSIWWSCSKCGTTSSTQEICQEIEDWQFRLEMNELFGNGSPHRISCALAQIEEHFHIKHLVWLKAAQLALHKLNYNYSFSALKLKKEIWERILDLYNILEPGLTRRRGMTLIELANANYDLTKVDSSKEEELSKHQVKNLLVVSKSLFKEAYEIFKLEPKGTPEFTIARTLPFKTAEIINKLDNLEFEPQMISEFKMSKSFLRI